MSETQERKDRFAKFIADGHMHYINNVVKRPASQAEYATWLGISPQTLTRLVNGQSMPTLENLIPIAQRLGPDAYEKAGIPQLAYTDPAFRIVMREWPNLTDDERRALVRNIAEMTGNERAHASTQTIPA